MYIDVKDHHNIHMDKHAIAKGKTINIECILNDSNSLPESSLGERVRKLRITQNLTIKDLAQLSCLSEETISNIEKSYTTPNVSSINKLCQALDSSNNYILGANSWSEGSSGEIIYKYRMISGLSQKQLAEKCNLHPSTIKDYEDNKIRSKDTLKIIYNAIGYL